MLLPSLLVGLILASVAQGRFRINTYTANDQTLSHMAQSENGNMRV
jgi:hypothetical protein